MMAQVKKPELGFSQSSAVLKADVWLVMFLTLIKPFDLKLFRDCDATC